MIAGFTSTFVIHAYSYQYLWFEFLPMSYCTQHNHASKDDTLIKLRIDRIPLYGVMTYFVSITGKGFITLQNKNKKHLANSLWHWGPYGSWWTGMSPTKYYMDRSEAEVHIQFCGWHFIILMFLILLELYFSDYLWKYHDNYNV